MKTGLLEVRPIFVRKSSRTKGHVFISMVALKVSLYFENKLRKKYGTIDDDRYNITLAESLSELDKVCFLEYQIGDKKVERLPKLTARQNQIFELFSSKIPGYC